MGVFNDAVAVSLGEKRAKAAYFGDQFVWGGEEPPAERQGVLFRALPGGADVSLSSVAGGYQPSLLYSTDEEKTWSQYTVGSSVHVDGGKSVSFKANGQNEKMGTDWGVWNAFQVDNGKASVEGHLSSLMGHDVVSAKMCFMALFRDCSGLVDASGLRFSIPSQATAVLNGEGAQYHAIFQGCYQLSAIPAFSLPGAAKLPRDCFNAAFNNCLALSDASGFGLGDQPWLSVGYAAFNSMFMYCSQLTAAPVVPKVNALPGAVYSSMFSGCSRLAQLSVQFTSWTNNYTGWLVNTPAQGDFYCPAALGTNATMARGSDRCPSGWTVHNTD